MKDITKKYTNGEITIVWKPSLCMHSTVCWKGEQGLQSVFNPMVKPWIRPEGAESQRIIEQVKKCPSGALSFYYNNAENKNEETGAGTRIEVVANGPLMVYGNVSVKHKTGETETRDRVTAFCRCGKSSNKPFCDGTHKDEGFEG
jgi:uncharacterized Fe-S cluster protein YjdI